MTIQISSILRQNKGILCTTIVLFNNCLFYDNLINNLMFLYIETRERKEKTIEHLTSLVKTKEGKLIQHQSQLQCQYFTYYISDIFSTFYIKLLRRRYCQCLLRDRKS